jgi:hypothetical protein
MAKIKLGLKTFSWTNLNLNKLPLELIPLHRIPLKKIGLLLNKIIPQKDIKSSEKVLDYIRIYTHMVTAYDLLNKNSYQRAFDHMIIVKNLSKNVSYSSEKIYMEQILKIINDILKKKRSIIRRLNKYEASDPAHSKTNLLLAQNICILRILKVNL